MALSRPINSMSLQMIKYEPNVIILSLKAHIHSKDCLILFNHMFENHLDHEKIGQKIPIK